MNGGSGDLAGARQAVESRWWELQHTLEREVGYAPRRRGWILLAIAAAAGFGLAGSLNPPVDELPDASSPW